MFFWVSILFLKPSFFQIFTTSVQDLTGLMISRWKTGPYRIASAAITPDGRKLVAVGHAEVSLPSSAADGLDLPVATAFTKTERRLQIFDIVKRTEEAYVLSAIMFELPLSAVPL